MHCVVAWCCGGSSVVLSPFRPWPLSLGPMAQQKLHSSSSGNGSVQITPICVIASIRGILCPISTSTCRKLRTISSVFGLRSSVFGLRSSVFGLRSFNGHLWPSAFRTIGADHFKGGGSTRRHPAQADGCLASGTAGLESLYSVGR